MKTAYLFPGQGAQHIEMGRDVLESYPVAGDVFQKAGEILGYDLQSICFEGPTEKLNSTEISQPAIFVTSAAILEVLRETGALAEQPDVTAGLSLGEYTALYAAGWMSFEEGVRLVQRRGEAMQKAADQTRGSMVSILGLDEGKVTELCEEAREGQLLEPANFNCPGQIVLSGQIEACDRAESLAEKYGAIKAVRLQVAGAFHTSMMEAAAQELSQALEKCELKKPEQTLVVSNVDCRYYESAEQVREGLTRQLVSPILWQKCMEKLLEVGFEKYYEIGPGRTLTGLMKRIHRKTRVVNISNAKSISDLAGTTDES